MGHWAQNPFLRLQVPVLEVIVVRAESWIRGPLAHLMEDAKYIGGSAGNLIYFNILPPPYFFGAVRSFGEYRTERDQNRPTSHSGSQELLSNKPANTVDFRLLKSGKRDLSRGRMAERKGLESNRLWVQVIDFVRSRFS
jgi:hypothetical protein